MAVLHRRQRNSKAKQKYPTNCAKCGGNFSDKELFSKVCDSNWNITVNAPHYCRECYKTVYGK